MSFLSWPTIGNRIGECHVHAGPACHNSSRPSRFFSEQSCAPSALMVAEMPPLSRVWSISSPPGDNRADSRPFHKAVDDFLLARFFEGDRELVAVDLHYVAVAELLVKHAVAKIEVRRRAGGFRDQLAFDHQRRALRLGGAARRPIRRLTFLKTVVLASAVAARAVGLRALPAGRSVARAEGYQIVEARGAVTAGAAPTRSAF